MPVSCLPYEVHKSLEKFATCINSVRLLAKVTTYLSCPIICGNVQYILAADVGSENDYAVAEIHHVPLAVSDTSIIEELEHDVEDVWMSLFPAVQSIRERGARATDLYDKCAMNFRDENRKRRPAPLRMGLTFHQIPSLCFNRNVHHPELTSRLHSRH